MSAAPAITDPTLLAFADEIGADGPVAVEGHRTRWGCGGALTEGTRLVRAPAGIVAYQPDEMTVEVRAGTPVAELHAELRAAGQRSALPERGGTVGGAVVVGEDDLRVRGVGRVRDAVLRVRYVAADGRVITGGGATVKNVSGFDLPRLLVGSLGTLGLVAQLTLRTNPIPQRSVWLAADEADPFAVHDALYRPSAVLWDGACTWVLLEGHPDDVAAQHGILSGHGAFDEVDGPPHDLPPHRWSLRPSELRPSELRHLDVEVARGRYVASIGTGTLYAEQRPDDPTLDPQAAAIAARAKQLFDPAGRLNPGRDPARR